MSSDNLIPIDGGGKPDAMKDALRNMRANLQVMMEYEQVLAQIKRAKYLVLVKEGFTEAQALELCK